MSFEINIVHGRTSRFQIDLVDQTGAPLDIDAGDLILTFFDPDTQLVVFDRDNTEGGGIVSDTEVPGRAELTIDDSDTDGLPNAWSTLYVDGTFEQDGESFPALIGQLRIKPDVAATAS